MKKNILLTREDNTPEEKLTILKECIEKCRKCNGVATIRQIAKTDKNKYNQLDIEQYVFSADCTIHINDGLVYVQLTTGENGSLQHVRQMHNIVRKRGTDKYLAGEENDYFLIIDLFKEDETLSIYYTFSLFQPQFFSMEHNTMEVVLPMERMHFFKEQLDRDEIEYEAMLQEETDTEDDDSDYDSGYAENDAYISGENFLN